MIVKVINPIFRENIGDVMKEDLNLVIAAIFYVFFVVGIYWFGTNAGIKSNSVFIGVASAVFLGLLAYGTYEFTSLSIIKGWTIKMVIYDVAWGGILTGTTAAVGFWVNKWLIGTT